MNEGRGAKAKQITAQMLRFMYALNINQTSYICTYNHTYIHRYIKAYTHTHTYIYYLCRSVTKRIVSKSGTVADAERRTGMRMRGGRVHKFISCPIQALPFLDLANCVDSPQTPTHTHASIYIHEFVCKYRAYLYGLLSMCCAPLPRRTHTHTNEPGQRRAQKIIRCVHFMYTHARTQTGPKTHNVIEAQAHSHVHTHTHWHCVHVQFEVAAELNLHLLCDFRTSRSDLQVI